jgi:hypothetical protein
MAKTLKSTSSLDRLTFCSTTSLQKLTVSGLVPIKAPRQHSEHTLEPYKSSLYGLVDEQKEVIHKPISLCKLTLAFSSPFKLTCRIVISL